MSERAAGVTIERLSFAYGAQPILREVSLEIGSGEFFAFLGPSGSGKTTLLRLVAGFGVPDAGRILVGGRDVTALAPWQRNLGMVFQNYALWPHMTVAENVAFGLEQRRVAKAEIGRRVQAALDLVGLGALGGRRPAQLSGGQQQRVALARTLVIEPAVLLLDEPLSNLDARLRAEMRTEIKALQRKTGLTTIFVTHDQEEANAVADRIAVLDQGRIQQVGRPVALYDQPANRFVADFLGTANLIDGTVRAGGWFDLGAGLTLRLAGEPAPGPATLMIRPQAITLAAGGLPAVVEHSEFLGSVVRIRVRLGGHRLVIDALHRRGQAVPADGAAVGLAVDPGECAVLPAG